MKLTESSISALSQLADPIGVISLYVGVQFNSRPQHPIEVKNLLRSLETDLRATLPNGHYNLVQERLSAIEPELDRILEPGTYGQGHALFAAVSKPIVEKIDVQLPLPNRVVFDKSAFLRPLVAALDEGRPAGLITVHKDGAHVFEWRLDETEELEKHNFDPENDEWREFKGPTEPNPLRGQQTASNVDRFERRLDVNRARFFKTIAGELAQMVDDRKWERLVLFGDPRLTQPMIDSIPGLKEKVETFLDQRIVDDSSPAQIQKAVGAILHDAQKQRELTLVRRVKELALSRSRACLGLRDTLDALNQSRVQHLLFDTAVTVAGFSTIDGQLFRDRDKLAVQSGLLLHEEPKLVERMVKRALEINAKVTPVEEQAARDLADYEGVAALLRW